MSQEHLLCGWDGTTGEWIKLQVDENGYVKVDLSAVNLDDLADLDAAAPDDEDVLTWDDAQEKWVPEAPAAGGYTEGAKAYNSAAQTTTSGTWLALAFDSESYDTDTIHDLVTNNGRLTCKTAGKYIVTAMITWVSNATGSRTIKIVKGPATIIQEQGQDAVSTAGWGTYQSLAVLVDLAVNEYVTISAIQSSGSNLNVGAASTFAMQRVG